MSGHATHRWPRDDSAENGEGAALIGKGLHLFSCNLDSLSQNQLPSFSPDISLSRVASYASNERRWKAERALREKRRFCQFAIFASLV